MLIFLAILEHPEDEESFTRLYHYYKGLAFWTANQILQDEHLAEDAVQEAFIRIAKNFSKISPKDSIECNRTKNFISIVVERAAIDVYRKRKRQLGREVLLERLDDTMFVLEDRGFEDNQEESEVFQAIRSLPKRYGEVMLLHYVHELNSREIARLLGMKEGTVRSNLSRGIAKLKKALLHNDASDPPGPNHPVGGGKKIRVSRDGRSML